MKYNISDQRLKVIADELGEEYKDLLIERILEDIDEVDADQINPSDLIRLDVATKSNLRNNKKVQRQNRMFSMISMLGIIYALFGLILMMWSELANPVQEDFLMLMSFILLCIGLFVALFSTLFKDMVKLHPQYYREKNHTVSPFEVVNKWKEIEALVHELTPEKDMLSWSSMINNLKDAKIISEKDVNVINRLLNIRNQIVHRQNKKYDLSQAEMRNTFTQVNEVISKLKKLV